METRNLPPNIEEIGVTRGLIDMSAINSMAQSVEVLADAARAKVEALDVAGFNKAIATLNRVLEQTESNIRRVTG